MWLIPLHIKTKPSINYTVHAVRDNNTIQEHHFSLRDFFLSTSPIVKQWNLSGRFAVRGKW
jgi:hypothetical protein